MSRPDAYDHAPRRGDAQTWERYFGDQSPRAFVDLCATGDPVLELEAYIHDPPTAAPCEGQPIPGEEADALRRYLGDRLVRERSNLGGGVLVAWNGDEILLWHDGDHWPARLDLHVLSKFADYVESIAQLRLERARERARQ